MEYQASLEDRVRLVQKEMQDFLGYLAEMDCQDSPVWRDKRENLVSQDSAYLAHKAEMVRKVEMESLGEQVHLGSLERKVLLGFLEPPVKREQKEYQGDKGCLALMVCLELQVFQEHLGLTVSKDLREIVDEMAWMGSQESQVSQVTKVAQVCLDFLG